MTQTSVSMLIGPNARRAGGVPAGSGRVTVVSGDSIRTDRCSCTCGDPAATGMAGRNVSKTLRSSRFRSTVVRVMNVNR